MRLKKKPRSSKWVIYHKRKKLHLHLKLPTYFTLKLTQSLRINCIILVNKHDVIEIQTSQVQVGIFTLINSIMEWTVRLNSVVTLIFDPRGNFILEGRNIKIVVTLNLKLNGHNLLGDARICRCTASAGGCCEIGILNINLF